MQENIKIRLKPLQTASAKNIRMRCALGRAYAAGEQNTHILSPAVSRTKIYAMEGYGLFVTQVCKDNQIQYYHGPKTIAYCAYVLFDRNR